MVIILIQEGLYLVVTMVQGNSQCLSQRISESSSSGINRKGNIDKHNMLLSSNIISEVVLKESKGPQGNESKPIGLSEGIK